MDKDKAIRSAKLTAAGVLDKARARTAVSRAGGQIAPSKYLPGVPRQVHADGGKVLPKGYSIHVDPDRLGVLAHYNGRPVGQLTLSRNRETGDLTAFQMAVHPKHQRKGLMSAMHDAAEDAFGPMKPDQTLTDQGFAFWKGYRPDAVSNNLRFHADKLMGQTVQTSSGPGVVKSVGRNGMNADLTDPDKAGRTAWAMARNNEDVLRNVGIDPSTLQYAAGGYVPQAALPIKRLPVAQPLPQQQPQGASWLNTLTDLAVAAKKPEEASQPQESPSAASEGHAPTTGVSANAQAALDALRKGWTGQDFNVISDYRSPSQNQTAGGAKGSQHLHGNAFDIDTSGWTPEQKLELATQAYNAGFRGFGFYDNNLHFDVGGQRAWGPSYHNDSIPEWAQPWTQQYVYRADGGKVGGYIPQQTVKAYKLFRTKGDGKLYPLFVNAEKPVPMGQWLEAEEGPQGKAQGKVKSKLGDLAYRPGWHAGDLPIATHIGGKSDPSLKKPDYRPDNHVWAEVEMAADKDWQSVANTRGKGAKAHIADQVPMGGFYRYKTNPNMTGSWLIGGNMKVNRVMSDDEVKAVNDAAGTADLPRLNEIQKAGGGEVDGREYFDEGGTAGDNFKDWFGNSVTHTNGEPHVFYTGTSKDKDFTGFNVGRHGAWFTRDPAVASSYAEQNDSQGYKMDGWRMVKTNTASRVIPAYVKAENPYTGDYDGEIGDNYKKVQSDWFDTLRAKGHDAWMPASQGGNLVVALKEPQQIKSIYNNGKFDPKQKHMGKAEGGSIEAYHGSPHDFDQFDISKINTGEGAQSYGHGLYFAGNEGVARYYRDTLRPDLPLVHIDGKNTGQRIMDADQTIQNMLREGKTPEQYHKFLLESPRHASLQKAYETASDEDTGLGITDKDVAQWDLEGFHKKLDDIKGYFGKKIGAHIPVGHMYKVKLNVGPHELLDWDAPLSEQHPNVQAALGRMDPDQWHPSGSDYDATESGQMAYHRLIDAGNKQGAIGEHLRAGNPMKRGDKWASEALMAQGIKGIRYRDAGSRGDTDGDPTHNYVMFHHDPVKVTQKYAYGGEVDDPMIGQHNTSAKGVEVASSIGGIPMPSMAISKTAHPLDKFGDVTLLAHPGMVTPSRDTNVWPADTYTGRQPRGDEEFTDPKAINRAMKASPDFGHMRDITYWTEATDNLGKADEMMKTAQLGVARGIDPKQHDSFHDYVSEVRRQLGYGQYVNDHMPGLRAYGDVKRVLYPKDLYTASGNRKKPVDYTLDAVMKRMQKDKASEAGAENWNYGSGNFRAIHTPKFASMGEIKADRGLIIPSEQMKPVKSQFEDAYNGLVEKLVQARGQKGFRAYDEAADALTEISKGRKADWFGQVPPDLMSEIKALSRHASKMPTEYFEAKSKRAIPLSAFPAAMVPKSDTETARRLTEAGVKNVMTYGSPEEKLALYRSQPDLMFKNGGKALALTRRFTKDGKAATMALKPKGK